MALTVEELILQSAILSDKTDSTTNPNMVYKSSTVLNKALDPAFFTGNNTKIVNAINMIAKQGKANETAVFDTINKTNSILMDISSSGNLAIWETVQGLMAKNTIIEGIKHILEGNRQEQILGLKAGDIGKVLSVDINEKGELIAKAIDMAASGPVTALNVSYTNSSKPEIKNVAEALDYILSNPIGGSINWDSIVGKPAVPNKLVMTTEALVMKENEQEVSKVPLTSNEDINNILGSLT